VFRLSPSPRSLPSPALPSPRAGLPPAPPPGPAPQGRLAHPPKHGPDPALRVSSRRWRHCSAQAPAARPGVGSARPGVCGPPSPAASRRLRATGKPGFSFSSSPAGFFQVTLKTEGVKQTPKVPGDFALRGEGKFSGVYLQGRFCGEKVKERLCKKVV